MGKQTAARVADDGTITDCGGRVAYVDPCDVPAVQGKAWYVARSGYVMDCATKVNLHRFLMGNPPSPGLEVDHKDRDRTNNRRSNLRWASRSQNGANSKDRKDRRQSRFRGVCRTSDNKTHDWRATININCKQKHLGYFDSEEEAGRAYDTAAKQLFGEFASLNFPEHVTANG